MRGKYARRGRVGIAELTAVVLTIAITLIAGAALFGYVNGQAANSENRLGQRNAANINFISEREVITFVSFPTTTDADVWVYNTGQVDLSNFTILVSGDTCPSSDPNCSSTSSVTVSCLYVGTCSPCGSITITPANTPIKVGTPPQSYSISIPASCGFVFAKSLTPPPLHTFTITFQGQFGSIASTTKGN